MSLSDVLTLDAVIALAGDKAFQRGLDYFREGAVGSLKDGGDRLQARVQGTYPYQVALGVGPDGELDYRCDCPVGEDGLFCKHAVAAALAWLEESGDLAPDASEPAKPKRKRATKADQIRQYLATLTEHELRELIAEAAERDRELRDRLLFAAKANSSSSIADLRALVRQATRCSGFLDWREAAGYGERLGELAVLLGKRIGDGNPKLVHLIEEAIGEAEQALLNIDDSNGEVYPAIEELQETHRLACEHLRPDPVALAERLFAYQMEGEWDTFFDILPAYKAALGATGLARYRQLVEAKWEQLPPLPPAGRQGGRRDGRRFRVEHAMTALAESTGQFEAIVAVKARDLSTPMRFLDLARLYQEEGRHDEALAWAEKGIAAFPGERLHDLMGFAMEAHLRNGERDKAGQLAWRRFQQAMTSDAFFLLVRDAGRIGQPDELRTKALAALREQMGREEATTHGKKTNLWLVTARNVLLEIFLKEKDDENAWAILGGGPTDMRLWPKAAALHGKTHPEEATRLYFKLLPHHVEVGARSARYEEAAETVKAIRALRLAQGEETRFSQELARIRAEYKAKRNFIKALAGLDV